MCIRDRGDAGYVTPYGSVSGLFQSGDDYRQTIETIATLVDMAEQATGPVSYTHLCIHYHDKTGDSRPSDRMLQSSAAVSYTHLDVYKRQGISSVARALARQRPDDVPRHRAVHGAGRWYGLPDSPA